MNKFKLVAGVILVFLFGTLVGSIGMGMYLKHRIENFAPGGYGRPARTALLLKRLSLELDLTEDQRIEIEKIIEESKIKIFAIRRKYLPEIKDITDQSFALMKEKLNPDQKRKLQKLHDRLRNRHAKGFIQAIQIEETAEQALSNMRDHLKLTEEQEIKVRPIIEDQTEQMRKIVKKYRENHRPDIFSLRHEIHKLEKSVEKDLAEIFTEKQMEDYLRIQEDERLERHREKKKHRFGRFH